MWFSGCGLFFGRGRIGTEADVQGGVAGELIAPHRSDNGPVRSNGEDCAHQANADHTAERVGHRKGRGCWRSERRWHTEQYEQRAAHGVEMNDSFGDETLRRESHD